MDPFLIQAFGRGATVGNSLASAHASLLGGGGGGVFGCGAMADRFGSQPFSFASNQIFGTGLTSLGNTYSLRPDYVSRMMFGKSWSVFANGQPLGWIGTSAPTNNLFGAFASGGDLGPRLQSGLLSVLASSGQGV